MTTIIQSLVRNFNLKTPKLDSRFRESDGPQQPQLQNSKMDALCVSSVKALVISCSLAAHSTVQLLFRCAKHWVRSNTWLELVLLWSPDSAQVWCHSQLQHPTSELNGTHWLYSTRSQLNSAYHQCVKCTSNPLIWNVQTVWMVHTQT